MKISSLNITQSSYLSQHNSLATLENLKTIMNSKKETEKSAETTTKDKKDISGNSSKSVSKSKSESNLIDSNLDPKLRLIKYLFEKLTGKSISIINFDTELQKALEELDRQAEDTAKIKAELSKTNANNSSIMYSADEVKIQSKGTLITNEGNKIAFSFMVEMSREYLASFSSQKAIELVSQSDSLEYQYEGSSSELATEMEFSFETNVSDNQLTLLSAKLDNKTYSIANESEVNEKQDQSITKVNDSKKKKIFVALHLDNKTEKKLANKNPKLK